MKGYPALASASVDPPSPTQLYGLEPIVDPNRGPESLTGYLLRLSQAHRVLPRTLINEVIREELPTAESIGSVYDKAHMANGMGTVAEEWTRVVRESTGQENLDRLTLLSLRDVVAERHLLREQKAWCEDCLGDRIDSDQPRWEPLLFQLEAIKVCPIHGTPLKHQCPQCDQNIPIIRGKSRIGRCDYCQAWLAGAEETDSTAATTEIQVTRRALELLMFLQEQPTIPPNAVHQTLGELLTARGDLNQAGLARRMGRPKNTVWGWVKGKNKPTLRNLLEICLVLGVTPEEFLKGSFEPGGVILRPMSTADGESSRSSPTPVDRRSLKRILDEALKADPPPSLTSVARRTPHGRRILRDHFPDRCRRVSQRYKEHRRQKFRQKKNRVCHRVRNVARTLHEQGVYPSKPRVEEQLSHPGYFQLPSVREAWEEVLAELGYQ